MKNKIRKLTKQNTNRKTSLSTQIQTYQAASEEVATWTVFHVQNGDARLRHCHVIQLGDVRMPQASQRFPFLNQFLGWIPLTVSLVHLDDAVGAIPASDPISGPHTAFAQILHIGPAH